MFGVPGWPLLMYNYQSIPEYTVSCDGGRTYPASSPSWVPVQTTLSSESTSTVTVPSYTTTVVTTVVPSSTSTSAQADTEPTSVSTHVKAVPSPTSATSKSLSKDREE